MKPRQRVLKYVQLSDLPTEVQNELLAVLYKEKMLFYGDGTFLVPAFLLPDSILALTRNKPVLIDQLP